MTESNHIYSLKIRLVRSIEIFLKNILIKSSVRCLMLNIVKFSLFLRKERGANNN